jgi:hypothetical protein
MRRTMAWLAALPGLCWAWQPPVELVTGAGERGPWQQNESRYDFVDDPAIALADGGTLVLAWVDQKRKAVLVQRRDASGAAQGPAVDVDRQPATFSWIPRVVTAPDDPRAVYVLWQEIIFSGGSHGGEMMIARSADGGRSFSPPVNLSNSVPGDGKGRINPNYWHNGSYDLRAAPGGKVYAAWTEFDGPLWFARSTDGGRTFGKPHLVAGGKGDRPARAPALAVHPDGSVLLAWTQGDHDGADIHVARSADGGDFSRPATLGHRSRYDDAPVLAVDGKGVVHLAWGESEGKPLQRQRIAYARSRDGGRSFEEPRVVVGAPAPFVSAGYPALGVDREGRVHVLGELMASLSQPPRALALAVSSDNGATFAPATVVPGSSDPRGGFNGSSQGLLMRKLLVAGDGRVYVVNSALAQGSHSRIWLTTRRE